MAERKSYGMPQRDDVSEVNASGTAGTHTRKTG